MKKLILIILFLGVAKAFAQYPIISDLEKKPGVYRDYNEFKNNRPSIKLEYPIIDKQIELSATSTLKVYALDISKKESREIGNVFGFCDGKRIFIVSSDGTILPNDLHKFVFYKVEYLLKYAIFDVLSNNTQFTTDAMTGSMEFGGTNQTKKTMFFNFATAELTTLTKNRLKEILSDKPELLEKFKKQSNKEDYLKKYLIDYLKS
ncbi:MAG: hypothetical protein M0D53_05195 [Flavobacterium sp. JAD_PAG50586_2]|nr:MAG: hypothetical protein M0D53_05195 [Flavobacterium sp. JAD_PAG50586_2]